MTWEPDHQAKALAKLFWSSIKNNDQETTETARTALYNHIIGQVVENYRNTGQDASQYALSHPFVLEVVHQRTKADTAAMDRMAKGYDYLSKLYKEDPVDRQEKALKALNLIDSLDEFLNRPQSMIKYDGKAMKVVYIK